LTVAQRFSAGIESQKERDFEPAERATESSVHSVARFAGSYSKLAFLPSPKALGY